MLIGPSHSVLQALGTAPAAAQPLRMRAFAAASEAAADVNDHLPVTQTSPRGRGEPARVPAAEVPTRSDATTAHKDAARPVRKVDILV